MVNAGEVTGKCPTSPALPACGRQVGGVKGHNMNDISLPGSPPAGGELHKLNT